MRDLNWFVKDCAEEIARVAGTESLCNSETTIVTGNGGSR